MSNYRIAVAPMIRVSTKPARHLWRILAPDVYTYSEMVHACAILHNEQLRNDQVPTVPAREAIQIAGDNPETLFRATKILVQQGWQDINLNAGCPATSAQHGAFGLFLLHEPSLLEECMAAMCEAGRGRAISLKCRIGVDAQQGFDFIHPIVESISRLGVAPIILHARSGWRQGLNPKENREIPPLDWACVARVAHALPDVPLVLNGGIDTFEKLHAALSLVPRVMLGRWVQNNPCVLHAIHKEDTELPALFSKAIAMIIKQYQNGEAWQAWIQAFLPWFHGHAQARFWRRCFSDVARRAKGEELFALQKLWVESSSQPH